ncbi:hypothetical protein ACO0K3_06430 [Undibacterium sp. Rencai35W]|uniref:hypothetical protein n=1 Tax=Undibacterium sp. Rencai35W TaxID=3413046 RepID=UPI003BEFB3CA
MKSKRNFLICLALLAVAQPAISQDQTSPQSLLVGRWRHMTLVRIVDGTTLAPQHFDGSGLLEFTNSNTWQLTMPNNKSAGTYKWLESGELEATTLESGLAIQVGAVSRKQVRVDNDRLNLITVQTAAEAAKFQPPAKPGVRRSSDVVITSIFSRVSSEK